MKWFGVIVLTMMLCMVALAGASEETVYVYEDFSVCTYEYTLNSEEEASIRRFRGSVKALRVPMYVDRKKVVAIGAEAYADNQGLECVNISNGVVSIESGAFRDCEDLEYVSLPSSVTSIAADAFSGCDKALYLVRQGSYAEQYCVENRLPFLYGGSGDLGIFEECVYQIVNEKEVLLLKAYQYSPYSKPWNMVVSATAPAAFEDEVQTCLLLSADIQHIGDYAFRDNKALQSVCIQIGTQSIGAEAFIGCENLRMVAIPDTVTRIGANAFDGCNQNLIVSVLPGSYAQEYCKQYGIDFDYSYGYQTGYNDYWEKVDWYFGKGGDVIIPKELGGVEIKVIGDWAFAGRTDLTSVVIPESVETIMMGAFAECTSLEKVELSYGLKYIGTAVFEDCPLKRIELPESVKELNCSFQLCTSLETIVIPSSVTTMAAPFEYCPSLRTVYVQRGSYAEQYCAENSLPYAYYGEYPVGNICYIAAESARVRSGAGIEHEVVGTVMQGERYEVQGILPASNGKLWYQIRKDGELCWVSSGVCTVE